MVFKPNPFEPPPLSNIRERLLRQQSRRLAEHEAEATRALQAKAKTSLSPLEAHLNAQYLDLISTAQKRYRDQLDLIEQQNVAAREAQKRLASLSPLERQRNREGFYRSGADRSAAILGILERERRRTAPLTREAYARAEAIAASRRLYDPQSSQLRGSRGYGYAPNLSEIVPTQAFDPCIDYAKTQSVRRQVMFAQGSAGYGYRTRHRRSPC